MAMLLPVKSLIGVVFAVRCGVKKVTRMLQSLLTRYESEGDKMLENTGVWVCTVCGFVYIGDKAPDLCPVCKVPNWKFEKNGREGHNYG